LERVLSCPCPQKVQPVGRISCSLQRAKFLLLACCSQEQGAGEKEPFTNSWSVRNLQPPETSWEQQATRRNPDRAECGGAMTYFAVSKI
jgi:hypothetical protein